MMHRVTGYIPKRVRRAWMTQTGIRPRIGSLVDLKVKDAAPWVAMGVMVRADIEGPSPAPSPPPPVLELEPAPPTEPDDDGTS